MIAEVNKAYQPALVVLDGVEALVNGGPEAGRKVKSGVILAGTDRVAIDVVAVGILRSLGTTDAVSRGSVWQLEQIRRAVELGLGPAIRSKLKSFQQMGLVAQWRMKFANGLWRDRNPVTVFSQKLRPVNKIRRIEEKDRNFWGYGSV